MVETLKKNKIKTYFKKYQDLYNNKYNTDYIFSGSISVDREFTNYFVKINLIVSNKECNELLNYSITLLVGSDKKIKNKNVCFNDKTISIYDYHLIDFTDDLDELYEICQS